MTIAIASAAKDAMLDAFETNVGTSAVLKIRTGSPPGIGNADSGTVLAEMSLPSDWMAGSSGGVKAKSGTWEDSGANASGDAGHFRIYKSDGSTQMMEGTVSALSGGGDMELQQASVAIVSGQKVTVSTFTLTAGN